MSKEELVKTIENHLGCLLKNEIVRNVSMVEDLHETSRGTRVTITVGINGRTIIMDTSEAIQDFDFEDFLHHVYERVWISINKMPFSEIKLRLLNKSPLLS